jgi:ligand-binding SRPBCC domain-containing protein
MLHTIKRKQLIKSDQHSLWSFISSPLNLALITPGSMQFEVINNDPHLEKMYAGQIIEYYVTPFAGYRTHWVTEITHVTENEYFADEQRIGPYKLWHHEHFIKKVAEGLEMTDIVHYKVPFGFLGVIANSLFIGKKLKSIFDYRKEKFEEMFNYVL